MNDIISLILGGGRGTRLYPLTQLRSKPAVPIGGKYRLIDIPISNCINSGFNRIYVLTQFLSVSLHRHIANSYKFDPFGKGFVEVLAAQQTNEGQNWYQGTADAVRQQIRYVVEDQAKEVLILSGDQLYRMDFRELHNFHQETKADVTIAVLPVSQEQVSGFGIVQVDETSKVHAFLKCDIFANSTSYPYHTVIDIRAFFDHATIAYKRVGESGSVKSGRRKESHPGVNNAIRAVKIEWRVMSCKRKICFVISLNGS